MEGLTKIHQSTLAFARKGSERKMKQASKTGVQRMSTGHYQMGIMPQRMDSTKTGLSGLREMVLAVFLMSALFLTGCTGNGVQESGASPAPSVSSVSASAEGTAAAPSASPSDSETASASLESPSADVSATEASVMPSPEETAGQTGISTGPAIGTTGSGITLTSSTPKTIARFNGEPIKVKAVYVSGPMAGYDLDHYIDLVNQTELNALVIDIKEGGLVNYETNAPMCRELGLYRKNFRVDEVLAKCHENGIYVIGRIVVFRDNELAQAKPEFAIRKPDGSFWLENRSKTGAWTSPAVKGVLDYNIEIAKEAIERGFDEIQFDYVRFPTVPKSNPAAYPADMPDKIEVIDGFLSRASMEIKAVRDVPIGADVFGIIAESVSDGKAIGQQLELLGANADYLSPMVYPSHYANSGGPNVGMGNGVGQQINGVLFTTPDLQPYDVVYQTLLKTNRRASEAPGFKAGIRPYLQDFTASYIGSKSYYQTYGPVQVRQQIQAAYDAGCEEWILWNGRNKYSEAGLLPAQP